ncbi:NAD-dependent epimerase/dehydratase family protein [Flagellatimonas centrodinii]|uniref:NAD-dependent epimerase/dehydratase family protein n=1 Tax=Flagellatimonas centrodinii TaxID=2806210 RepID=UPI001FF06FEA|nr:NAD-dependent epimerase/dehydratase family protein [Flagellatimonas centrodinii]ULQ45190.1 NAD-dependent epimerase/dehydratase family protein [Flagellatimonas centrodinii]
MSTDVAAPPTILVTGAAGALARRVIQRLSSTARVVGVDTRRQAMLPTGVPSYLLDMRRQGFAEVFREHAIDAVIHIGRVFTHEQSRMARYNANVLGTRQLLEQCCLHEVSQVLVHSTYLVYGARADNPSLIVEGYDGRAEDPVEDLVDAVELERLAEHYAAQVPQLNMTLLRPCNIVGPGVRNTMALLLSRSVVPVLLGHSPVMQFLHVDDMADAMVLAFRGKRPGTYNVAPDETVPLQEAFRLSGCRRLPVLAAPAILPRLVSRALNWGTFFPPHLIPHFRYPAVIDGSLFQRRFQWYPRVPAADIFEGYRLRKWGGA